MELKNELKRLYDIAHSGSTDAMERYQALSDEIMQKYTAPEEVALIGDFLLNGFRELENEAKDNIRFATQKQQSARYADVIPLGYNRTQIFQKN